MGGDDRERGASGPASEWDVRADIVGADREGVLKRSWSPRRRAA